MLPAPGPAARPARARQNMWPSGWGRCRFGEVLFVGSV